MRSSLESKTIRPGLMAYSFYRSDRHPMMRQPVKAAPKRRLETNRLLLRIVTVVAVIAAVWLGYRTAASPSNNSNAPVITALSQASKQTNPCVTSGLSKYVVVSIGKRHLWACQAQQQVYDTPVITGMTLYASTTTPTGIYHVASKQANTTLRGSDEAGSWNDPVHYWMPFLTNQYGQYGFHDATWRPGNPFGQIDPNSKDASHGCVELPLNAAAWLYSWAEVGTTVAIQN